VTWQDAGVILIVGGAVYYLARKFLLPVKAKAKPATFISIQQLKSKGKKP
jgi:hypothetical protein